MHKVDSYWLHVVIFVEKSFIEFKLLNLQTIFAQSTFKSFLDIYNQDESITNLNTIVGLYGRLT